MDDATEVGTPAWVEQTSGWLTDEERRALVGPLLRSHARWVLGRLASVTHLSSGRRAFVEAERLRPPDSPLTNLAEERASAVLPTVLLDHSHRTYCFGRAIGDLEGVEVDAELLFAAAMLHGVGLVDPSGVADFTLVGARVARQVAERVGLSTAATEIMRTAITMHCNPGVRPSAGAVPYLLAAGAAVDVVGLRADELPPRVVRDAVDRFPRAGFTRAFESAFRDEAARVPRGRARFLLRYGAFAPAVRRAPLPG